MNRRLIGLLAALILFTAATALAQQNQDLEQGLKPYGAFHGGDIDSISLGNGNVVMHIPLVSYPQRGNLHFGLQLYYNDKNWEGYCLSQNPCVWAYRWRHGVQDPGYVPQGVNISTDFELTPYNNRLVINNLDGSRTTYLSPWVKATDGTHHKLGAVTGGLRSLDGSGIYVPAGIGVSSWTVIESNGTRQSLTGTTTKTVEDTNGNKMTKDSSGNWTDSLGRVIPAFTTSTTTGCPAGTASAQSANLPGYNGGTITIKACYKTFSFSVSFPNGSGVASPSMMTAVLLPDGTQWLFNYESTGSLSSITLPTGGTLTYTYTTFQFPSGGDYSRAVTTRTVNANDGTGNRQTTYSYAVVSTVQTTTVVDAAGNQAEHDFVAADTYGFPHADRYYSGSGGSKTLLKTVASAYTAGVEDPNFDGTAQLQVFPTSVTTTFGAKTSQTTATQDNTGDTWSYTDISFDPPVVTTYPLTIGSTVQTTASDWGAAPNPGAVLKKTVSNYLWTTDPTTKTNNLLNRLSSAIIQDGSSNRVAETDYYYDQTSVASSGVTTQHNSTPTATKRGNQTTVSRWLTGTTFLNSTATYFDTGKTQTSTDPGGHATTFAYNVTTLKGAFPTQVTGPTTGGVTHVASTNYDFNTGVVTSSTDQNGNATSYNYDSSFRLTQRSAPDGGQVNFAYTNSAPFKVTVTAKITSTMNVTAEGEVDGLGRVKQTRLTSDPEGTDYTDTTYDVVGHVATVSNPYRNTSESTYGVTTSNYDALGRLIKTIPTDGTSSTNNVVTSYADNCVVITDQAGKTRKTCSDGLDRLTQVFEPDSGGNFIYETDYQYDTLGNLTRVDQKGNDANSAHWRTRTFVYDALSRITQSNNPELGTINYTYDSDSNLIQKDSPAPNQTNPALRQYVTFCYDELHRETKKYLSQQTCTAASPDVTNYYDQTSYNGLTITNPKPNRTGMSDASGATAWSYDVMGRVITQRKTIAGITKTTGSTYNLDGSVSTVTSPSGRTITYSVSAARRPLSAVDSANSINFATTATYSAWGSLVGAKYGVTGSFTGIVTSNTYNKRLQPAILSAAGPSQTVLSLSYDFGLNTNNNGDAYGFTNNRDTNRSETFTYDQLNRVSSGQTTSNQWGTNYTFDIWGNLLQKTPMSGKTSGENLVQAVDNNNRLTGCGFDAAGNQTNDCLGHTITYDAENRVSVAGGVTYTYDGDGQRVKKSSGKLYWGALTESDLSGNATADFVFFGSQRIARVDLPSGTVHYFFADHLGSTGVVTNATGSTIEQEIDHRPFGEESIIANTISDQNYRFMGKEHDAETAYDFFGARYYNSMSGRWLSPDWTSSPSAVPYATLVNPQTLNLYAFVRNNPATNTELDGHTYYVQVQHLEWHYDGCDWCSDGLKPHEVDPNDLEDTSLDPTPIGKPDPPQPNPQPEPAEQGNATSGNGSKSADAQAAQKGQIGGTAKEKDKSDTDKKEAAVVYSEKTDASLDEAKAIVSVIENRASSGDKQYVDKGQDVNVDNVINHANAFQGVGGKNYNDFMKDKATGDGAKNATAAVAAVHKDGTTNNATFFIVNAGGKAPSDHQVKQLGKVNKAEPEHTGDVYLYKPQ